LLVGLKVESLRLTKLDQIMSNKIEKTDTEKFTGKQNGIPFDRFDEKVISWGRLKYGEKYAKALWRNELVDLKELDVTDELDLYKFEEHCSLVNDVIACESPKYASTLLKDKRFQTVKWQIDCRYRFREKLFCYLETLCTEEASRQLVKRGVNQMSTMRDFFFRRFGASQPEKVQKREEFYLAGMPNANGEVFPPRCHMEDKLNALEKEREFLLDLCPKDMRESYESGKETTMVRMILKHIPKEYDACIKTCRGFIRMRKAGTEGNLAGITNLEDHVRMNYCEDWLPDYTELRTELVNEFHLHERRRAEENQKHKGGHPVLPILQGHDQPGPEQRPCYGCGQRGDHMRGDPKCPAGPNAIWDGAPEVFKDRIRKQSKGGRKGKGGKGKGKQTQRNFGMRNAKVDGPKVPCPNWNRGNGFCKYGPNCRNSHDGPKGEKQNGKRKHEMVLLNTKKGKKARKQLSSLLIKELAEGKESSNAKVTFEEDDNHLYQLIRGMPTVLIVGEESAQMNEYVPVRNNQSQSKMVDNTRSIADYLPITDFDRIIRIPGEHPFIPWNEYDGCCKEGEYDLELDAFVRHHYRTEPIVRKKNMETQFTVTLMVTEATDSDSESTSTSGTEDYSPKSSPKRAEDFSPKRDLIDPPSEKTKEVVQRISDLVDLIDRPSVERERAEKSNLIDRTMNTFSESKESDLIDRNVENPKSRKLRKMDFKPKPELDVFFDNFEKEHYERELEISSDNLKRFSESKNYAPENEMLEWRWRAQVAEERASHLQDLKTRSERISREKIDLLENKIKRLSQKDRFVSRTKTSPKNNLEGSSSVGDDILLDERESSDDEWIVIRIPKGDKLKFSADFMDKGVGDGKEWLDGPCDLNTSIQELLDLRDEGRAVRKAQAKERIRNEGRRRVRFGSGLMKPSPSTESLRRSIAPGSYDSWSGEKDEDLQRKIDRQFGKQRVDRESSSKTIDNDELAGYTKMPSEIFGRARRGTPLRSEKRQGLSSTNRENFRMKLDRALPYASLPAKNVSYEELVAAEKSRLKRVRSSRSGSEEEDDRMRELTYTEVVNSNAMEREQLRKEVLDKQQRELDFYSLRAKSHQSSKTGFSQLCEAKQRIKQHGHLRVRPKYEVGDYVSFTDREQMMSGRGFITRVIMPGEKGNECFASPEKEIHVLYELDSIANRVNGKNWIKESVIRKKIDVEFKAVVDPKDPEIVLTVLPMGQSKSLHPMDHVGIDTCSAVSVSTEAADFLFVDRSYEAKNSISLNGVGIGGPEILGRGPMVVSSLNASGEQVFMVDPSGVLISKQSKLRILGQQKMKRLGFHVVQSFETKEDNLIYKNEIIIPLTTINGILMVKSVPWCLNDLQMSKLNGLIDQDRDNSRNDHCFSINDLDDGEASSSEMIDVEKQGPVLIINEAKLSKEECARLDHWRFSHRSSTGKRYEERCHTCEQSKHKSLYKLNDVYHGTSTATHEPYWRLYGDAYGGQKSMGSLSYQGGIGGFVFVCPISGKIKAKLYSSQEQFPAILYQLFLDVESEGYTVREFYCDTNAVNISAAAEEVAGIFKVKIIPISGGTPQELAYAESAVRTLGQMSRAQMIGAPHLPPMMWGLSDLYAAIVHSTIPQKGKGGKSPYEIITKRIPNREVMFIHVFGCPCQYEPANSVEHKRAAKTEWGWFVGLQWPMVLILRPFDLKILSISRKKVHCHEEMYAKFNPETMSRPRIEFKDFKLDKNEVDEAMAQANDKTATTSPGASPNLNNLIPDHVLSVKSLSDAKRNTSFNTPSINNDFPNEMRVFNSPQPHDPGENFDIPDWLLSRRDHLLEEIKNFRAIGKRNLTDSIINALKGINKNEPEMKGLPLAREEKDTSGNVDMKNITLGKRKIKTVFKRKSKGSPANKRRNLDIKAALPALKLNDRVKMKTCRFGVKYAKGKSKFTYGMITQIDKGKIADVKWETVEGEPVTMSAHVSHLQRVSPILKILSKILNGKDDYKWPLKRTELMFPVLEVGSQLTVPNPNENGNWPKDFIEALIRPDWRSWVEAVKNENESWDVFEATLEVPFNKVVKGASVIPLGELFTIKRSGKYKFRQIALGNLLKEGKDYGETFASTVSGDGLRWFCSLGSTCGKEIRGWDATTGYLQTVQRVPVYAYLPSHHGYSNLEYEELAKFRMKLLDVLKTEGMKGIKDFSKRLRNERRIRPETVLELKRSVYGIPDAGQSFSMYMQSLHLKQCGMVQSDLDPCVYYKIIESEKDDLGNGGEVLDYLLVITWVDDCRYFGTEKLVKEYEATISKHCKCTMEGISSEFVSIKISHNLSAKTLELTQKDYWEKAVVRFKEFLPVNGPKERLVPLSPRDEKLLVEPTEEEIKAGEHLPFPNVLGVVQYPSNFTKLEMRYAMSVLSRHRTKWGKTHFEILLKALEYGYSTRMFGVKYNGNLNRQIQNILIAYADSAFTIPRSQGCRLVLMNGAAISFTSKRHTTTDDSTTCAELTEAYLASCDVEGFRNLNAEIGLRDDSPTILYQDNQAAIQIAMNRGSLSKKTRATEIRTLTIRNKIEDFKVVPIYCETTKMLADLGTKALEPKQFIYLRDQVNGYSQAKL
jgi:hypothetical protein